jgi:hypothetical protein
MKIPWKNAHQEQPVLEEQYRRRRLDGVGVDTVTKEFLAIELKKKQDVRSNYVEKATAAAQEQYKSLLMGIQTVCLVKVRKVQQVVFVGGTCGSVHVESFNSNMKTLGFLETKWDPIRRKLDAYLKMRSMTRCCGPTSHRGVEREARGEAGLMERVGNMYV